MLAVRLPPDLESRLAALAARTGRSKSYYARLAIERQIEDLEDHFLAEDALKDYDPADNVTLAELKRLYGLDDPRLEAGAKAA